MGDSLMAELPHGVGIVEVGTNGAHQIMLAQWLAAYALAGRPKSWRVVNWVDNRWPGLGNRKFQPAAPDVQPPSPRHAAGAGRLLLGVRGGTCTAIVP